MKIKSLINGGDEEDKSMQNSEIENEDNEIEEVDSPEKEGTDEKEGTPETKLTEDEEEVASCSSQRKSSRLEKRSLKGKNLDEQKNQKTKKRTIGKEGEKKQPKKKSNTSYDDNKLKGRGRGRMAK